MKVQVKQDALFATGDYVCFRIQKQILKQLWWVYASANEDKVQTSRRSANVLPFNIFADPI